MKTLKLTLDDLQVPVRKRPLDPMAAEDERLERLARKCRGTPAEAVAMLVVDHVCRGCGGTTTIIENGAYTVHTIAGKGTQIRRVREDEGVPRTLPRTVQRAVRTMEVCMECWRGEGLKGQMELDLEEVR